MVPFVEAALAACREVRSYARQRTAEHCTALEKGFGGDVSRGIDLIAEAICYRHLHRYGSVFSEESGWMDPASSVNIILDPIDGSDNFVSDFPYYGISIALQKDGKIHDALVCNLSNGDVFVRTPDTYVKRSLESDAVQEEILTNPYAKIGLFEKSPEHPRLAETLMRSGLKFRSPGALALSLAYAPYVKYVLFLGTMRPYDIEAGLYLSRHLHSVQTDRFLLIAQEKEVFERILAIVDKEIL